MRGDGVSPDDGGGEGRRVTSEGRTSTQGGGGGGGAEDALEKPKPSELREKAGCASSPAICLKE